MYKKNGAKVNSIIKNVIRRGFCYWKYNSLLNNIIDYYIIIIITFMFYYTIYFSLFSLILF